MRIKKLLFQVLLWAVFAQLSLLGQDTFSIVAVDPVTRQVGSAGASCLDASAIAGGVSIIGKLYPNRGAINTQSYWNSLNQNNAGNLLSGGFSPQEVIDWLSVNDAQGAANAALRQYGIVDFDPQGNPRAAAFTGANCFDYKNHIIGPNYAIQGNILLGQEVLDSMEARFLNTEGELAVKLMAALQGAKMPGADTRCADEGISSLSAYIRVANPTDAQNNFYLNLVVPETPLLQDPIDLLQTLFNNWLTTVSVPGHTAPYNQPKVWVQNTGQTSLLHTTAPNLAQNPALLMVFNLAGKQVKQLNITQPQTPLNAQLLNLPAGVYLYQLHQNQTAIGSGKFTLFGQ